MHSTSSNLQFVHGAPCSTTLHRTLRALQHWQAFDALLFTLFAGRMPFDLSPASLAVRFGGCACNGPVSVGDDDDSDIAESMGIEPIVSRMGAEDMRRNSVGVRWSTRQ